MEFTLGSMSFYDEQTYKIPSIGNNLCKYASVGKTMLVNQRNSLIIV